MKDGRGSYVSSQWQDLKKSGGLAVTPQILQELLTAGGENVLTRDEVLERVKSYFMSCMAAEKDAEGNVFYRWARNPTKTALALSLGVSVQTLTSYVNGFDKHGFIYKEIPRDGVQRIDTSAFDILRNAYMLIQTFYEEKLGENRNNAGVIFWLLNSENRKWSNEQEFKFIQEPSERQFLPNSELPTLEAPSKEILTLPTLSNNDNKEEQK